MTIAVGRSEVPWRRHLAHVALLPAVERVVRHIIARRLGHGLVGVAVGALHAPTLSRAERIDEVVTVPVVPLQRALHVMRLLHHVRLLHRLRGILRGMRRLLSRLRRVIGSST